MFRLVQFQKLSCKSLLHTHLSTSTAGLMIIGWIEIEFRSNQLDLTIFEDALFYKAKGNICKLNSSKNNFRHGIFSARLVQNINPIHQPVLLVKKVFFPNSCCYESLKKHPAALIYSTFCLQTKPSLSHSAFS